MKLPVRPCELHPEKFSCGNGGGKTIKNHNCSFCLDWVEKCKSIIKKCCSKCPVNRLECKYFDKALNRGKCELMEE